MLLIVSMYALGIVIMLAILYIDWTRRNTFVCKRCKGIRPIEDDVEGKGVCARCLYNRDYWL